MYPNSRRWPEGKWPGSLLAARSLALAYGLFRSWRTAGSHMGVAIAL